jgi:uncharacterized protein YfbU (UPF0304 family)
MKLSDSEKLSLLMLSEIHMALKLNNNGVDSKFITKAIESGNEWAISQRYGDYLGFHDNERSSKIAYMYNVLEMWSFIEEGVEALSAQGKKELEEKAAPFGKNPRFSGFDGNNESKYHNIAHFIANEMDAFGGRFAKRDLNSHIPRVELYQKMLKKFDSWLDNYPNRPLNVDEIAELLNIRAIS